METPIPKEWIIQVAKILRSGNKGKEIIITRSALQDWEDATNGWPHELLECVIRALI